MYRARGKLEEHDEGQRYVYINACGGAAGRGITIYNTHQYRCKYISRNEKRRSKHNRYTYIE